MEEQTEREISYSGYPKESSSDTSSGESVGDTGSHDLPPGFERFESDSTIPAGFEWCTCDLTVEECCANVCDLWMEKTQKQRGDEFVIIFTTDYLRWFCCPPGYLPSLHIRIWDGSSRQLVAFVAAVPIRVRVMEESSRMAHIHVPAIQSDFRDRIPAPMAFPMWKRPLNSRTLFKLGIFKNAAMTIPHLNEFYKLPRSPDIWGFKEVNASHVEALPGLLNAYLQKFNVAPEFNEDEFKHWFLPTADLVHSYIYVRPDGNITGFCSFITLRESREDSEVKFAHSFYNFTIGMPIQELMRDAIIVARENHCDAFFAYGIMSNRSFMNELRFSPKRLHIQYDFDLDGICGLTKDDIGLLL